MRLVSKNSILGCKFLTFRLEDKSDKFITKQLLVMIYVFSFLQLFPIAQTAARTANNSIMLSQKETEFLTLVQDMNYTQPTNKIFLLHSSITLVTKFPSGIIVLLR